MSCLLSQASQSWSKVMTDISKADNEDILTIHDNDQAIDADEIAQYNPNEASNVVVVEPTIISIGRAKRAKTLRTLRSESGAE